MESIATLSCSPPVASGRAVPRLRSIIRPLILLLTSLREPTNSYTYKKLECSRATGGGISSAEKNTWPLCDVHDARGLSKINFRIR